MRACPPPRRPPAPATSPPTWPGRCEQRSAARSRRPPGPGPSTRPTPPTIASCRRWWSAPLTPTTCSRSPRSPGAPALHLLCVQMAPPSPAHPFPSLLTHPPLAIEGLDARLVDVVRKHRVDQASVEALDRERGVGQQ